nr:matrix protein [Drosophila busckii rhabdovirus]
MAKINHDYHNRRHFKTTVQVDILLWGTSEIDPELLKKMCACIIWEGYKGIVEDPMMWKQASQALYSKIRDKSRWSPVLSDLNHHAVLEATWFSLTPRIIAFPDDHKVSYSRLFNFRAPGGKILSVDYKIHMIHNIWDKREYGNLVMRGYTCLEQLGLTPRIGGVISLAIEKMIGTVVLDPYKMVSLMEMAPLIEQTEVIDTPSGPKLKKGFLSQFRK